MNLSSKNERSVSSVPKVSDIERENRKELMLLFPMVRGSQVS